MRGAIPSLSQYAFMAWYSVKKKHRDNFTFTKKLWKVAKNAFGDYMYPKS
jgi:hypothetical protein